LENTPEPTELVVTGLDQIPDVFQPGLVIVGFCFGKVPGEPVWVIASVEAFDPVGCVGCDAGAAVDTLSLWFLDWSELRSGLAGLVPPVIARERIMVDQAQWSSLATTNAELYQVFADNAGAAAERITDRLVRVALSVKLGRKRSAPLPLLRRRSGRRASVVVRTTLNYTLGIFRIRPLEVAADGALVDAEDVGNPNVGPSLPVKIAGDDGPLVAAEPPLGIVEHGSDELLAGVSNHFLRAGNTELLSDPPAMVPGDGLPGRRDDDRLPNTMRGNVIAKRLLLFWRQRLIEASKVDHESRRLSLRIPLL
jgi:hypothetical protein